MMTFAPIVLFVYNRPSNTLQTLNALSENDEAKSSTLYIYCDGPKGNSDTEQLKKIQGVRELCKQEKRFKEVIVFEKDSNNGLAGSIINGVTEIVHKHGKIIVLEDDIFTSKFFLKYMNEALDVYQDQKKVISIGACNYFLSGDQYPSTFFLPIPDCLGWATWSDRWNLFEPDSNKLLKLISEKKLTEKFNLYDCYNFNNMLKDQAEGKVSSWAIRWQAIAYLNEKVSLYPNPSLTQHIASFDSTHVSNLNIKPPLATKAISITESTPLVKTSHYYLMMKGYYMYFERSIFLKLKKHILLYVLWKKNKNRIISENHLID